MEQLYVAYPANSGTDPLIGQDNLLAKGIIDDASYSRVAVIDLGSSSFHLLVAEVGLSNERVPTIIPVVRHRSMLHLGKVVAQEGHIPGDIVNHAMEVVRRHRATAHKERATATIVLATAAIRDAANATDILRRLNKAAGTNVHLLEGHEEARLIFIGQWAGLMRLFADPAPTSSVSAFPEDMRSLPLKQRFGEWTSRDLYPSILSMDLGGGSLELAFGKGDVLSWTSSVNIGVARLAGQFAGSISPNDPLSPYNRRKIYQQVAISLESTKDRLQSYHPQLVAMSGGTARALVRLANVIYKESRGGVKHRISANPVTFSGEIDSYLVDIETIEKLAFMLSSLDLPARLSLAGVQARRAPLLPIGACIMHAVMKELSLDSLLISEWGLREGAIVEFLHRSRTK